VAGSALGEADRAMLVDLQRAASTQHIEPCLIGAAALGFALQRRSSVALPRTTRDWDFAVAVRTWQSFEDLAARLVTVGGPTAPTARWPCFVLKRRSEYPCGTWILPLLRRSVEQTKCCAMGQHSGGLPDVRRRSH